MANLFMILFLLSIIAIVIAITKPGKALFFMPKEKQTRKYGILIFGLTMFISFVGANITGDSVEETNVLEKEEIKEKIDVSEYFENQPMTKVSYTFSDEGKAMIGEELFIDYGNKENVLSWARNVYTDPEEI